jgi:pyruvate-formate lyase-activating enzyme
MIYKGLYLEKVNQDRAQVSACCANRTHPVSTVDFIHDPKLVAQRRSFQLNERIAECEPCWTRESATGFSMRTNINHRLNNQGLLSDPFRIELTTLDYNTDPICNAKCIMCSPYYSSLWAQEEHQFTGRDYPILRSFKTTQANAMLADLDVSCIQRVYFNGGEPLATDDHVEVLTVINSSRGLSDVEVSYNTNGSIVPNAAVQALWRQARAVIIHLSIDGVGAGFEYIRNPLKWARINETIDQLSQLNDINLTVNIAPVVGVYNLFEIFKIQSWFEELKNQYPKMISGFYPHHVYGEFSLATAAPELKQAFLEFIANTTDEWADNLRGIMSADTLATSKWIDKLNLLDQRRNNSWQTTFPELAELCKINGLI